MSYYCEPRLHPALPPDTVSRESTLTVALGDQPEYHPGNAMPTPRPAPQANLGSGGQAHPPYVATSSVRTPQLLPIPLPRYKTKVTWRLRSVPFRVAFEKIGEEGQGRGVRMQDLINDHHRVRLEMSGSNDRVLNGITSCQSISLYIRWPGYNPDNPSNDPFVGVPKTSRFNLGRKVAKTFAELVNAANTTQTHSTPIQFDRLVLLKVVSYYEGALEAEIAALG